MTILFAVQNSLHTFNHLIYDENNTFCALISSAEDKEYSSDSVNCRKIQNILLNA